MAAEFIRRCKNAPADSLECEVFRGILVFELTNLLAKSEIARDKRAAEPALAALALTEEPEILVAASRLLGRFPDTPNLAPKLIPLLLESPYIEVQRKAAAVLRETPDQEAQLLGRLWTDNHSALSAKTAADEYPDFPDHYAKIGFPKYPGAKWFPPADSDRSVGWSTGDDLETVARWFGTTLRTEVLNGQTWPAVHRQQTMAAMNAAIDPAITARMQQIGQQIFAGKGTPAMNDEYARLAKSLDDRQNNLQAAMNNGIVAANVVQHLMARDARWIVAQKKGERISQLVIVFPVPTVKRTGIALVWDLSDYPSAWPPSVP